MAEFLAKKGATPCPAFGSDDLKRRNIEMQEYRQDVWLKKNEKRLTRAARANGKRKQAKGE